MRKITFYSKVTLAKEGSKLSTFVSKAAQEDTLKDLRNLLPAQEQIDEDKSLTWFAGPAANVNLINLNNVGITFDTAMKMQKSWRNKPVNMGHDRSNVVGFITDSGFSTFSENKIITTEEASFLTGPLNITVSGILWKMVGSGYDVDIIEMLDNPSHPDFHCMSMSWEVGFDEYVIAIGNKNLSKARIIRDDEEIKQYSKYLLGEENEDGTVGSGFTPAGDDVYLVVSGEPNVMGLGLVLHPAASVRGIVTTPNKVLPETSAAAIEVAAQVIDTKEIAPEAENKAQKPENQEIIAKKVEKSENSLSQTKKTTVKPFNMSTNPLDSLFLRLTEAGVSLQDQRATQDHIDKVLKDGAAEYAVKLTAASDALEASKRESTEVREKLTVAESELTSLKAKLAELEEKVAQEEKQTILASRIDELSEKYDLSKASVKKAVVKQIKDLNDADYATWLKEDEVGGVLLAGHLKQEKASVDIEEATKALKQTQASITLPNAQDVNEKEFDISKFVTALTK